MSIIPGRHQLNLQTVINLCSVQVNSLLLLNIHWTGTDVAGGEKSIGLLRYPFNGLFQDNLGKPAPEWLNQTVFWWSRRQCGESGFSWIICKSFAPCCRQITMPTLHRSIFTGLMLFLTPNQQCQSTEGTKDVLRMHRISVQPWLTKT